MYQQLSKIRALFCQPQITINSARERGSQKSLLSCTHAYTRTKLLCHICVDRPILSRLICDSGGVRWRHRSQNISWFTYKCLCKVVFLHPQLVDKYYIAPFSFNFQPCPMSPPQDVMPMLLRFLLACCPCSMPPIQMTGHSNWRPFVFVLCQ